MRKLLLCLLPALVLLLALSAAHAEEITLVDDEYALVVVTGMKTEDDTFLMKLHLENRTDVSLMFCINDDVLNGYSADTFWAKELAPGETGDSTAQRRSLGEYGVTGDVTVAEFTLRVYNNDDWSVPDFRKERFVLYPLGQESASVTEREPQPGDVVIADNEYMTLIAWGYRFDSLWGLKVHLYVVNKTDAVLMVSLTGASLNGYALNPAWACEIPPRARSNEFFWFNRDSLEENNVTDVKEIDVSFRAFDFPDCTTVYFDGGAVLRP